jgi:hypothetical protein
MRVEVVHVCNCVSNRLMDVDSATGDGGYIALFRLKRERVKFGTAALSFVFCNYYSIMV